MSEDYQRVELITGTARRRHLVDGAEATDHRGEFSSRRDGIVAGAAAWRRTWSIGGVA